uniref:Toxin A n=1 Tax=Vibrio tasmaniensis TaxID=212663 RepID=A0A0H3ZNI8_9VIBR|nr:Toxin A [Vibrio tasmaniensis]
MYFNELTLRQNPACASDILRLSLLYRDGGMYVDVDTLPSHRNVYKDINITTLSINENLLDIIKSEYLLREIRQRKRYLKNRNISLSHIEAQINDKRTLIKLKERAANRLSDFYNQDSLHVHRDIIKVATQNRIYEINNNTLLANKGSRCIRIILKEVIRRYNYLDSNNFIYSIPSRKNEEVSNYLSRLDKYRYDGISSYNDTEVTLLLTGPCLIHEVLLGLCYEVFKIPKNISPTSVSYIFRIDRTFLGFNNQTHYTPEHMRSSWL